MTQTLVSDHRDAIIERLSPVERQVRRLLFEEQTFEQVARAVGRDVNFVYRIAKKYGWRKREDRIRLRAARQAALEARVADLGATKTMDVLDYLAELNDASAGGRARPEWTTGRSSRSISCSKGYSTRLT